MTATYPLKIWGDAQIGQNWEKDGAPKALGVRGVDRAPWWATGQIQDIQVWDWLCYPALRPMFLL